jgi:hypothetical protein
VPAADYAERARAGRNQQGMLFLSDTKARRIQVHEKLK